MSERADECGRCGSPVDLNLLVLDHLDFQSPNGGGALHATASSVNGNHDLFLPDVSKCQTGKSIESEREVRSAGLVGRNKPRKGRVREVRNGALGASYDVAAGLGIGATAQRGSGVDT